MNPIIFFLFLVIISINTCRGMQDKVTDNNLEKSLKKLSLSKRSSKKHFKKIPKKKQAPCTYHLYLPEAIKGSCVNCCKRLLKKLHNKNETWENWTYYSKIFHEPPFISVAQYLYEALMMAISTKNEKIINAILTSLMMKNASSVFDYQDQNGVTLLHKAAMHNLANVVTALIRYGASVEKSNKAGKTPLHYAAQYNAYGVIKELLLANANPCTQDTQGQIPLHIAAARNHTEFISALQDGDTKDLNKIACLLMWLKRQKIKLPKPLLKIIIHYVLESFYKQTLIRDLQGKTASEVTNNEKTKELILQSTLPW